jgi:hypothetical protein
MTYRLARDAIADAWPAASPGRSYVRLARGSIPILVHLRASALQAAHNAA